MVLVECLASVVGRLDLALLVLLEPVGLISQLGLEMDVGLAVGIHVLHQVDLGLVLTAPLVLPRVPLASVLIGHQLVDHLLVGALVVGHLAVVSLQLYDFLAAGQTLSSLNRLDLLLVGDSRIQKLLVSLELALLSLLAKLLLRSVVLDQLQVPLTVQ